MTQKRKKRRKLTQAEKQQALREATITNALVFSALMRNEKIAKKILEIILSIKIDKIKVTEYEKTIELIHGKKGIRIDIYLEGSEEVYNIEMQVEDKYNLILRARYYSAMLDLNKLEKGQDYNKLPKAYVIFICMFDPFGKGQAKYVFSNKCELDDGGYISMGDESYKVFLNAKNYMNTDDKELKDFLEYIATQQKNSAFIHEVHDEIEKIKSNQKWGLEFMTFLTNYRDDVAIETKRLTQALKESEKVQKEREKVHKQELKQEQQARKQEQQARKQEQQARKQEQKAREKKEEEVLINQLGLLDDSTIAQIYGKTPEDIAKLREKLLGKS